jgi:polyferredoxin
MAIFHFVLVILAAGALVNAWLLPDGLFSSWRQALRKWGEPRHTKPTLWDNVRWWFAELLNCRICLTYHVAWWLIAIFYVPSLWLTPLQGVLWLMPVYALAATRISLLIGTLSTWLDVSGDPECDTYDDE